MSAPAYITAEQFLDRVKFELDERGWTQGLGEDDQGRVCLYGAIHKAFEFYNMTELKRWWPHLTFWDDWKVSQEAVLAVWGLAQQRTQSIASMQIIHPEAIVFFNDRVAESVDDVKNLIDDAKKQLV